MNISNRDLQKFCRVTSSALSNCINTRYNLNSYVSPLFYSLGNSHFVAMLVCCISTLLMVYLFKISLFEITYLYDTLINNCIFDSTLFPTPGDFIVSATSSIKLGTKKATQKITRNKVSCNPAALQDEPIAKQAKGSSPLPNVGAEGLGGKIVAECIANIKLQLASQGINLPINFTSAGLNATSELITMINALDTAIKLGKITDKTQLKYLKLLLEFITANTRPDFHLNLNSSAAQLQLLKEFPVELAKIS